MTAIGMTLDISSGGGVCLFLYARHFRLTGSGIRASEVKLALLSGLSIHSLLSSRTPARSPRSLFFSETRKEEKWSKLSRVHTQFTVKRGRVTGHLIHKHEACLVSLLLQRRVRRPGFKHRALHPLLQSTPIGQAPSLLDFSTPFGM